MHRKMAAAVCVFSLSLALLSCAVVTTVASDAESSLVILTADWMRVEPEAEAWPLIVTIFSTKPIEDVKLQIKVESRNITAHVRRCPNAPPINLITGISTAALRRFVSVVRHQLAEDVPAVDLREFDRLSALVRRQAGQTHSLLVEIPVEKLPFEPKLGNSYSVMIWADAQYGADATETTVLVSALPKDTAWIPAELHAHSTVSDNHCYSIEQVARVYRNLGYRALYMTDHLDGVERHGWPNYVAETAAAADGNIIVLSGVEISTAYGGHEDDDDDDADVDEPDDTDNDNDNDEEAIFSGDLLAYGLRDLAGLTDPPISPEQAIKTVQDNNPPQSSSAIAHPSRSGLGWGNWTLSGYSGLEIMSGWQFEFGPGSRPFRRWIADMNRQLPNVYKTGCFPGVRAGGDWHGLLNPRSYVTWMGVGGAADAEDINQALRQGRTVASRFGGLAKLTLALAGQSYGIGEIIPGTSAGTAFQVDVSLQPVTSGSYKLAVYQSNRADPVMEWDVTADERQVVIRDGRLAYPGGEQCYYLVVTGADFICTSPIFIGN